MSELTSPQSPVDFAAVSAQFNNVPITAGNLGPNMAIGIWAEAVLREHLPNPIEFFTFGNCIDSSSEFDRQWFIEVSFKAIDGKIKTLREPANIFPSQDLVAEFLLLY